MIIGGKKTDSSDGKVIEIRNPITTELIDTVPNATKEDIDKCVTIAQKGKRIWADTPLHERSRILFKFADVLKAHTEELGALQCKESGKSVKDCEGEVCASSDAFKAYTERANHLYGETLPDSIPGLEKDIFFTRREPLGVFVCIVPFNYPIGLFTHKVAPGLIMGNAIIVKPSSENPLEVIRLVELLMECGVPGEVIQVVTGGGSTVGRYLVQNPGVDAVSLTGSTEVGIEILKDSAPSMHRVFLECGGNDPLIVFEDADIDLAVAEAIGGRVPNGGQICSASKRFIVQKSVKEKFTKKLIENLQKVVMGDPMDRKTDVGSLINEKAAIEVEKQIEMTVKQGAKCVFGGKRFNRVFFEPTVLTDVTSEMDIARDLEVFGPVFPIIQFSDFDEAIQIANNTKYGLQGGIISADLGKAISAASKIECGTVVINGSGNYRHLDHAFGGYKRSGTGREGASQTLEELSQVKTYVLKSILKK